MKITRPRATAFTQLAGVASAAQMGSHVLAAINASVEVTKIANAQLVDIAWAKVTKTGSSLADLATRSAGDLNSGDLLAARMSTNIIAAIAGLDPTFTSITIDSTTALLRDVNNSYLKISGSSFISAGGSIELYGEDHVSEAGDVWVTIGSYTAGYNLPSAFKIRYLHDGNVAYVFAIDKDGNITTVGTIDGKDVSAMEPSGMITLWSGAISAIPTGWVLCDGANSTPNLTDRFVIHADADAAGTRNVGDTGGAMTHTNTIAETAAHNHTYTRPNAPTDVGNPGATSAVRTYTAGIATGSTGSGNAHSILNKFHALAYIMKT